MKIFAEFKKESLTWLNYKKYIINKLTINRLTIECKMKILARA